MGRHREAERLDEVTVDAEPDAHVAVERLDVDVGGAVAQRLTDDARHELHDRRLVVEADLGDGVLSGLDAASPSANAATSRSTSASERYICSMNEATVLSSEAFHTNFWPAADSASARVLAEQSAAQTVTLPPSSATGMNLSLRATFSSSSTASSLSMSRPLVSATGRPTARPSAAAYSTRPDAVLGEQDLAELPEVAITVGQRRREGVAGQMPGLDQRLAECHALLDALTDLVDRRTGGPRRSRRQPSCRCCPCAVPSSVSSQSLPPATCRRQNRRK